MDGYLDGVSRVKRIERDLQVYFCSLRSPSDRSETHQTFALDRLDTAMLESLDITAMPVAVSCKVSSLHATIVAHKCGDSSILPVQSVSRVRSRCRLALLEKCVVMLIGPERRQRHLGHHITCSKAESQSLHTPAPMTVRSGRWCVQKSLKCLTFFEAIMLLNSCRKRQLELHFIHEIRFL